MTRLRMFISAILGGAVGGVVLGVVEAALLTWQHAPPDLWLWSYAEVIYGVLGGVLGISGAVLASSRSGAAAANAGFFGTWCGVVPLAAFVARYLMNKEVYLEQGVPLPVLAVVLFSVGLCALVVGGCVRWLLQRFGVGQSVALVKACGLALLVVSVSVAVAQPPDDPRAAWSAPSSVEVGGSQSQILLVLVDTLRADHLGAYGSPVATPNFDALAADGIVFEQAIAAASWTRASGASLMTSQLPSAHGASAKASRLADEAVTYAEVLRRRGLVNGALINNINLTQTFNFDQGFDAFIYESPEYRFGATESVFALTLYKVVHKLAERLDRTEKVERFYQPASVVLGDARRFIDAHRGKSWSLLVHLMEPHDPYFEHPSIRLGEGHPDYSGVGFGRAEVERPRPEQADALRALYTDEVRFLDRELGRFIDGLKRDGRYDDLTIVVTADHGEEFNEHGGFWHGTTLYDEQIRVPLIMKLPKARHAGIRIPWQARLIDVAPTLAALVGESPDPSWQGADLLGDVDRWAAGEVAPEDGCGGGTGERVAVSEQDFEGNQLASIRTRGAKWIRANSNNPRGLPEKALFRLPDDAGEQRNLVGGGDGSTGAEERVCGEPAAAAAARLDGELRRIVSESSSRATHGGAAAMGSAECERLKALGYLGADEPCQ